MAMAVCSSTMSLLFVILMGFLWSSRAHNHTFYVGGDDGWTLKPSESYNYWAERYRFKINNELVFKYKKGNDSVLVVNERDYYKCNKDDPIKTLKDGESRFKFDRSGPFFFISGHDQNCEKGQKLIVVVLSNHHRNTTHNPPSQPPETPLRSPSSSPSPSPTPISVPPVKPPSHSPSPSPAAKTPAHAPPLVKPPSHSPTPSPAEAKAPVPSDHNALPPHAYSPVFSPHHAPAPAPSSASDIGGSFVLIVGLNLLATVISAGLV